MDERNLPVPDGASEDNDRRQAGREPGNRLGREPGNGLGRQPGNGLGRRIEDRSKIERISVRSLIALLLAGAGIALALSALWLQYWADKQMEAVRPQQTQIRADIVRLRQALAASDARLEAEDRRLEALESLQPRVAEMADSIGKLNTRMEASQRPWIAAEARYLIEIANRRLSLDRDVASALAALEAAQAQLQTLRDPGLNGVRRTLAAEIQSLQTVRQPDLAGIALQLAAAEQTAGTLPVLGAIADRYRPEDTEKELAPGFARAWQLLRSSFTNLISIRRIGQDAVELVSLEEQAVRQHHLQLLLFFTRTAAVRGDRPLFKQSIDAAREWLRQMFDPRDAGVIALSGQLQKLAGLDIEPVLPDISGSLKLLDRLNPPDEVAQ